MSSQSKHFPHLTSKGLLAIAVLSLCTNVCGAPLPGETLHLGFESEEELLSDFVTQLPQFRFAGREGLAKRRLTIEEGRFGKALHIRDGWPISKGAWNESGLDCDLIVATMWGEWHKKAHFWGAGAFHGNSGSVAFWVKSTTPHAGIIFMQGHVGWGRAERDLFSVEVDKEGRLSAFIRDIRYDYHRVNAEEATWTLGEWQHVAVSWDRAFGLKIYYNGRLVGSTWGEDAWWQTGHPGLFSPFLPESFYDEIRFFDRPLSDAEVASLYESNSFEPTARTEEILSLTARQRLMSTYADLEREEIPTVCVGDETLRMKQVIPEDCHDEQISAWWVMDGRYELAWPHPYRLFTFILGDVDFHGTTIDMELPPGDSPNYISFEGVLDDLSLHARTSEGGETLIAEVASSEDFFHSRRIDTLGASSLSIPLAKEWGSPPDLEGSAHLPLAGKTRIHELQLWQVEAVEGSADGQEGSVDWFLSTACSGTSIPRYGKSLQKLASGRDRLAVLSQTHAGPASSLELPPMSAVHLFSPGLSPDMAVDSIGLRLLLSPKSAPDVLWINVRDPGNPSRIWAKACVRVEYRDTDLPAELSIDIDIADLMLASEDRLWVEIVSAEGAELQLGDPEEPSRLIAVPSTDKNKSLSAYAKYEMLPSQLQYSKEYNYKPWLLTKERVNIRNWKVFGGPYDMAYPPLAVLRHDPENELANTYEMMVLERGRRAWVLNEEIRRPMVLEVPQDAPDWAIWQREIYRLNERASHWIASHQREDGQYWGGWNDDSFIPLGYPHLPLMGDDLVRKSLLRFYDGMEEAGIFADGYCDIWPIDPLHITDYITSRGLMLALGLGDPQVLERELRTSERYWENLQATNKRLAEAGHPPLTGERTDRERDEVTLIEAMGAQIFKYSSTHVRWYWGQTEEPPPHELKDRSALARRMMEAVQRCDEITLFDLTESMVHTDGHGGGAGGREDLVSSALGGRLQGRIEPHPHSIAVSWEGAADENLARLVSFADGKALRVNLYNLGPEPVSTTMRLWRIKKGKYDWLAGVDSNDDGSIDCPEEAAKQSLQLGRFSTIPIQVPPGENIAISIEQSEGLPSQEDLPDLAISSRDISLGGDGSVEVVVHNIGFAPVRNALVRLIDNNGRVLGERRVKDMDSPAAAFQASRKSVRFQGVQDSTGLTVVLDGDNEIEEIFEENNTAGL